MPELAAWYSARRHMLDAVVGDLYGTDDDSSIGEDPLERYIVGILHPRAADGRQDPVELADEEPEAEAGVAPDAGYDPGVSFAHLRYPSTMGLTFGVSKNTTTLLVEVEATRYESNSSVEPTNRVGDGVSNRGPASQTWAARPTGSIVKLIDVSSLRQEPVPLVDGLQLRVVVRPQREGVVNVTLVLVNTFTRPEKGRADGLCWFRPSLKVAAQGGTFVDRRPDRVFDHMDSDELSAELLYRRQRHLAVGHGVGVTWSEADDVTELATTFFPRHALSLAQADREDVPGLVMSELAEVGVRAPLHGLIDQYESWIAGEQIKLTTLNERQQDTGRNHLDDARAAVARMRRGLSLLDQDPSAALAFQVMNKVMQEQRVRQELIRRGLDEPPAEVVGEWRPFQMAFILLNLEGLVDEKSPDRDLADLLWFPTGGGKTEAYLGLIAFTLVHRRIRDEDGDGSGVGVIMRYTLRLLTLQQFERAAGLICALEQWRDGAAEMVGKEPFSIGLWVGQGATPNDVERAYKALRKRRAGEDPGDLGDPVQLLRCPWCGAKLGPDDYEADRRLGRLRVRCPRSLCRFAGGDGLPVHLVDSDVYRARPSLVIGTVDKFAMLAWNADSGRLLGRGSDAPPDLIVQDELHLISGPLGTLVGLYETAIDHLATSQRTGARPKLVASTATVRRASEQMRTVFARDARQFPPPGIDAGDSFFAVDATADMKGTRLYVGLMAPGTSHATLLVRTYAALLQGAHELDASDEVKDAYWTLLGYFNSLRVLGAAYIQSIDDVRDRIKVVAGRGGHSPRETKDPRELTSRKKSSEIPVELEALQTALPDRGSPDVVLATNMISVGVDVDRLGLMVVMGQPQTTSEYIQATSRVGRRHPGLVFTLFNASRSRDLSHYEAFTSYHRAIYKEVEATGATPFAPRALDRGLHGLLVVLARHTIAGAAADKSAQVPVETMSLTDLVSIVTKRARQVEPASEASVREALENLIEQWTDGVDDGSIRQYARWPMQSQDVKALMVPAGTDVKDETGDQLAQIFPPSEAPWPTLTSLRNVDRESTFKIISSMRTKAVDAHGDE